MDQDTEIKDVQTNGHEKKKVSVPSITIRFAGDSGDGMQLTGKQLTGAAAIFGNDIGTMPDFPAEIRAPAGTLYGVSGYQLRFSDHDIYSPGDVVDVLVAMNPAALKVNIKDLKKGGTIIANEDAFDKKNLQLAKYEVNPLEDGSLDEYIVHRLPITKATLEVVKDVGLSTKAANKCKNFYALGLMYWLYDRSPENTIAWVEAKFKNDPLVAQANVLALKAGYNFGETSEIFSTRYDVQPAKLPAGTYRSISGNEAIALGLVAAGQKTGLKVFLGSYPITPASDILHYLSRHKNYNVITFQAEDEIAGVTSALGASFAGSIGVTTTSGPGMALKAEAIGLAVMVELPLVIIDVQRAGPSTGMPTKTEQADLLQAMYGRNSESPVCVLAPATPSECFTMAYEAVRIAIEHMTPVILLSDGYIANGSEPWKVISSDSLPVINAKRFEGISEYQPYMRDELLVRPWVNPGTAGLEHRIGGLEKENITGNVSYDPKNHEDMVKLRAQKIKNISLTIPDLEVKGSSTGELLVLGWGGTYGEILTAVERAQNKGLDVSYAHLRYMNPMPKNTGEVLKSFKKVLIPELNMGQLSKVIRGEFSLDTIPMNKIQGQPFKTREILGKIEEILNQSNSDN